ncbi:hypothetical protein LT679_11480 [Mucilaginibacter roseus]|uniref:Uncharacterized protein n=1 Tax=Mucilaginibacter roseus TaxID=1528868 RepID=A0ABS8U587_9SPHI|nr:hypothetical protein [Mucilaginibacter roseus]MCD8741225.1 hypothetical protein [Mucilaginibacter roseus]
MSTLKETEYSLFVNFLVEFNTTAIDAITERYGIRSVVNKTVNNLKKEHLYKHL